MLKDPETASNPGQEARRGQDRFVQSRVRHVALKVSRAREQSDGPALLHLGPERPAEQLDQHLGKRRRGVLHARRRRGVTAVPGAGRGLSVAPQACTIEQADRSHDHDQHDPRRAHPAERRQPGKRQVGCDGNILRPGKHSSFKERSHGERGQPDEKAARCQHQHGSNHGGSGLMGIGCVFRPLVLERGREVKDRVADVRRFDAGGPLDPESNYLFGEGGAGTFSDGKLTSRGTGPGAAKATPA